MSKFRYLLAISGTVALLCVAAVGQQGAVVGSAPGSAIKAVKPATVTNTPEEASMTIACQSAVELMITDPQGRRLGYDPVAHASFDEIPRAYYEAGGIEDDETGEQEEDPAKTIFMPNPAGSYKLTVVGTKAGEYSCEVEGVDRAGKASRREFKDVAIELDQVQMFAIRFGGTPGSKIEVERK